MRLEGDEIISDKDEFLVNVLLAGIAVQMLEAKSELTTGEWMQYLSNCAEEQLEEMTPKQRDEMINAYIELSQNA